MRADLVFGSLVERVEWSAPEGRLLWYTLEVLVFKNILRDVVENTDGAVASILMGYDGITVESYSGAKASIDMETVGGEYSQVLNQVKTAAKMLEMGTAKEVSVQAENLVTVMRLLNDEYFVALAIKPNGNIGKGRFLLRLQSGKLLENLT